MLVTTSTYSILKTNLLNVHMIKECSLTVQRKYTLLKFVKTQYMVLITASLFEYYSNVRNHCMVLVSKFCVLYSTQLFYRDYAMYM